MDANVGKYDSLGCSTLAGLVMAVFLGAFLL